MTTSESPPAAKLPIRGATGWPLTFVWYGDHWTRDWADFWSGASHVGDPAAAAREEGAAMTHLVRDWMVAMGALWTFPVSAWLAASPKAKPRTKP